jgi:Saxitoxin biosynthesis operon protein SxtJ
MKLHFESTKEQNRNTGVSLALLFLLLFALHRREALVFVAMVLLALDMIVPQVYKPVAVVWFGLSELLGIISSKVLLSIAFFIVVVPIGLLRRFLGKDSLKLKAFKQDQGSVMSERNHKFVAGDIVRPF